MLEGDAIHNKLSSMLQGDDVCPAIVSLLW